MESGSEKAGRKSKKHFDSASNLMAKRETLEFVRAYYRIKDPAIRSKIMALTQAIAG
jgi:hypothetical protein